MDADGALTVLFVGLHRELRAERLAATRFIQVEVSHVVGSVIATHGGWSLG